MYSLIRSPPFDIGAAKKACSLFLGTHNFTSFMKKPVADELFPRNPVRFMQVADLSPGTGFLGEHNPFKSNLEYWDFTFRSSGFLQRQVSVFRMWLLRTNPRGTTMSVCRFGEWWEL